MAFRADHWFDCSETVVKQLMDFSRHRGRQRPSATVHTCYPRPPFAYSLYNFYWATTTIKGRLLSSRPMLKPFSGAKILSRVEMGSKNGGFGGKWGSKP